MGRQEARRDPGFFFREQMALSDDLSVRLALLDELESYPDAWTRRRALPWVDLLVEDLAAVGTIRRVKADREPVLSHPVSRGRAYGLLGSDDDFRSRGLLLECLRHEEDPSALAAGFRALGKTGTDWDGASMRLIAERFRSVDQPGDRLVLAAAEALADLVRYNGGLSDPSGAALMDELLRSDASPRIRSEVIGIIRGTMGF